MKFISFLVLALISFAISAQITKSEGGEETVIQFTGVVFATDSISTVPGTHVYIPKSGRGTTTNPYGFFSLPVLEGDSVVFSAVGFKKSYFIIPAHKESSSLKAIIVLEDDIQFLEEVEIRPYPTEYIFKEALISMELPERKEYVNVYQWLESEYMRQGYQTLPASPNANSRSIVNQYNQAYVNKYSPPQNQLLNPFAWNQFINSLRRDR